MFLKKIAMCAVSTALKFLTLPIKITYEYFTTGPPKRPQPLKTLLFIRLSKLGLTIETIGLLEYR
jgi:hypothetical protein